jgi:beta-lactamase regulating signal transducer with metallopeptidase domain
MEALAFAQFGFAPALASALLHSLWQNALLGLAAALTLRAMARASAASRHNAAMAFLAAMLLVPVLQFVRFWDRPAGSMGDGLLFAMAAPRLDEAAGVFVQHSSPVAALILLAWLAGVALMLVRHVAALRALAAIERAPFQPLPPLWRARADRLGAALGIVRRVAVRVSDGILTPFAARLFRPVIWVPLSLLTRAPADQIEALLAHELAHIARRDWLWNGLQCLVETLLFFHPAVWWLGRRIRQEREHACDDLAVAACGDAVALAEALASLECERHPSPRLSLAANGGSLMQRISRLLTGPPSRGRWGALAALGALSVASLLVLTQIGLAGGGLPDLQVTASTDGPLGPGDYREVAANGIDKSRWYRISLDEKGRPTEQYRENGKDRPITADARRWLAEIDRLSTVPAHPAPPSIEDMPEARALLARISAHPNVVARVGTPAAATSAPVNGNIRISGAEGDADIEIEFQGPKGRSVFTVEGEMKQRVWTLSQVEAR